MKPFVFCPYCRTELAEAERDGKTRRVCPECDWVSWGNPTPVVAAIVLYEGDVILVRQKGWPDRWVGLVSGFLEAAETPADGVRTTKAAPSPRAAGVWPLSRSSCTPGLASSAAPSRFPSRSSAHPAAALAGGLAPVIRSILRCRCISPQSSASGLGGHPGTYTSTGMTRSTPWVTA